MRLLLSFIFVFSFQAQSHDSGIDFCNVDDQGFCRLLQHEVKGIATIENLEKTWVLSVNLVVKNGGLLQIGPDVRIVSLNKAAIIVEPGGRILILGTKDRPVVIGGPSSGDFRLAKAFRNSSEMGFGGLRLYGQAPIASEENSPKGYHLYKESQGDQVNDTSGTIRHLIIRETASGRLSTGLLLAGVGKGTKIENVDIQHCADDCLSIHGGSVDIVGITVDHSGDDLIDVKYDYQGEITGVHSPTQTYIDRFFSLKYFTGDYSNVVP